MYVPRPIPLFHHLLLNHPQRQVKYLTPAILPVILGQLTEEYLTGQLPSLVMSKVIIFSFCTGQN